MVKRSHDGLPTMNDPGRRYPGGVRSADTPATGSARDRVAELEATSPGGESLRATFRRLADTWSEETGDSSFIQKKVGHPAYQQIIELGPDAVPLILCELKESPAYWFW